MPNFVNFPTSKMSNNSLNLACPTFCLAKNIISSSNFAIIFLPVAVTTSQYSLPNAPNLNPPGRDKLFASWTGLPSFHTYSTSDLAQPSQNLPVLYSTRKISWFCVNLQLAISRLHVCSSSGKRARYMEQKQVREILIL